MAQKTEDTQERLNEVTRVLTERGQLRKRANAFQEAGRIYLLASQKPAVESPWPELAAYRYAREIIKSRDAASSTKKLQQAADLMEHASKAEALGPLPLIYRVAILERLYQKLEHQQERAKVRRLADDCFVLARNMASNWYAKLYENNMDTPDMGDYQSPVSSYFNLLEVISLMRGFHQILYAHIPGSNPFNWQDSYDAHIGSSLSRWVLVSHADGLNSVPVPKAIAFQHLESLMLKYPDALFFRISDNRSSSGPPIHEYCLGGSICGWKPMPYGVLLLLAYSLMSVMVSLNKMKDEIDKRKVKKSKGDDTLAKDNYFKKQKMLLKRFLKQQGLAPGIRDDDILFHDPQKKALRLNKRIPVYGVIDEKLLPRAGDNVRTR